MDIFNFASIQDGQFAIGIDSTDHFFEQIQETDIQLQFYKEKNILNSSAQDQ
ncbi:MAG: hypothetical protein AAGK97_09970 [Bacteroidota bacterium]